MRSSWAMLKNPWEHGKLSTDYIIVEDIELLISNKIKKWHGFTICECRKRLSQKPNKMYLMVERMKRVETFVHMHDTHVLMIMGGGELQLIVKNCYKPQHPISVSWCKVTCSMLEFYPKQVFFLISLHVT